ncbi:WXG100-like domain-containing protein [Saccharothrix luteola]|uniref:WXG100-like domain-containing protein n=1 Tax=Saccharothrix luteola TaxID=2893018 RepID=UPI001E4B90C2|nr:hypothetical protein [Saccharothrix luteola]MCC8246417.1 hypothetical protein [Saccharothrix luteola]
MAIPEPEAPLWPAVKPLTAGWPVTDELLVHDLATAWANPGAVFEREGQRPPDQRLVDGWDDGTGEDYRGKVAKLRDLTSGNGAEMNHLAWLARRYAEDVAHTKDQIRLVIDSNNGQYEELNGFLGLYPDTTARKTLVVEVADSINTFLRHMAERIAARGRGAPELPLPVFTERAPDAGSQEAVPPVYPNQMPEDLRRDLDAARRLGVEPTEPGTPEFDRLLGTGEKLKWAVLEDGRLVVVPKHVDGVEIKHSVLSGGAPVRAAGEVEIAGGSGRYYSLDINNRSGHFRPPPESLDVGREAFRRHGIEFE